MKIALKTQFGQHLALTPQLQRSIQLLQISSAELEEEVAKAAEENPMLDYSPPDQSKDDGEPNEKMEMMQVRNLITDIMKFAIPEKLNRRTASTIIKKANYKIKICR